MKEALQTIRAQAKDRVAEAQGLARRLKRKKGTKELRQGLDEYIKEVNRLIRATTL